MTATAVIIRLSPRELQVLRELLKDGADNPTIARRLVVSVETVKSHTKSIFVKAGVPNRTALVVGIFRGTILVMDPHKVLSQ